MASGDVVFSTDFRIGVVARGRRTVNTSVITSTETGVLRIDSVPVFAGRAYLVILPAINVGSTVSSDVFTVSIRVSTSGAATTSSTRLSRLQDVDPGTDPIYPLAAYFFPSADGTASFLMSVVRTSGTGNVAVFCSATDYLDMVVADAGFAPADTGVVI